MRWNLPLMGLIFATMGIARGVASAPATLYVAPAGSDHWSGRLPMANAAKTDGPLATPIGARNAVCKLRAAGEKGPVTVSFGDGVYWMAEPLVLEPGDSGTADGPTVYVAQENKRPVLSGGRLISGWKVQAGGVWSTRIPDVTTGRWVFQQLWVNGQRRVRARSPNEGYYRMVAKGPSAKDAAGKLVPRDSTSFLFANDDIRPWTDIKDAQVVVFHSWETSRLRIANVDVAQRRVDFTGPSCWAFEYWEKKQRYYVENVREALDSPGEWYMDCSTGTLEYLPMPGEDMNKAEVVAPRLTSLVELHG